MTRLRQPTLGILATLLIMIISLAFISLFQWATFSGWVSLFLICTIPVTIVIGITWAPDYPRSPVFQRQPLRGLLLLLIVLGVGAVVTAVHFLTVGGAINPPVPMLIQCIILSVPVTFGLTVIWGGWPFTLISNRLAASASLLVASYVVNFLLFRIFFNYGFMHEAPIYRVELDPAGLFDAWSATTFAVTCLAVMFLTLNLGLWPFTKSGSLMKQPVLGLVWTAICLVLGAAIYLLGTEGLGIAAPVFLIKAPIPFIFGSVIVLTMLGDSLFHRLAQPSKGLCNIVASALIGSLLTALYGALGPTVTGPLVSGLPTFDFEVWVASALLAVTFPFLAYFADLFQMWPFKKSATREDEAPVTTHEGSSLPGEA